MSIIKISIAEKNSKMGKVPSFSTTAGKNFGCSASDTSGCDPDPEIRVNGSRCYVCNYYKQYRDTQVAYNRNLEAVQSDLELVKRQICAYLNKKKTQTIKKISLACFRGYLKQRISSDDM